MPYKDLLLLSHVDSLQPHGLRHGQAFLYLTNSRSLLKLMSIELVMPSNHPVLCRPPIFTSIQGLV